MTYKPLVFHSSQKGNCKKKLGAARHAASGSASAPLPAPTINPIFSHLLYSTFTASRQIMTTLGIGLGKTFFPVLPLFLFPHSFLSCSLPSIPLSSRPFEFDPRRFSGLPPPSTPNGFLKLNWTGLENLHISHWSFIIQVMAIRRFVHGLYIRTTLPDQTSGSHILSLISSFLPFLPSSPSSSPCSR